MLAACVAAGAALVVLLPTAWGVFDPVAPVPLPVPVPLSGHPSESSPWGQAQGDASSPAQAVPDPGEPLPAGDATHERTARSWRDLAQGQPGSPSASRLSRPHPTFDDASAGEVPLVTELELLAVLLDPERPAEARVRVRYRGRLEAFGTDVLAIGDALPPPLAHAHLLEIRADAVVVGFDGADGLVRTTECLRARADHAPGVPGGELVGDPDAVGGRRVPPRRAAGLRPEAHPASPRSN